MNLDPVSAWLQQFRLYLELGAAAVIVIGCLLWNAHERSIGAAAVHTADAKAQQLARDLADAQTKHAAQMAIAAERKSDDTQKAVDAYAAAHPSPAIRLCFANSGVTVLPPAGGQAGGTAGPGAGSDAVPQVPGGNSVEGPDVSGEFDALVQGAQRLAVLYAEAQEREPVSHEPPGAGLPPPSAAHEP